MAIEDEDSRDREMWAGDARFWYSKAADRNPLVGRLSHHLAILARPNAVQQMCFYSRSLTSVHPFMSARESIMTLVDPFLSRAPMSNTYSYVHTHFIKFHASLFVREHPENVDKHMEGFLSKLNGHVECLSIKAKEPLAHIAIANIAALHGYGIQDHPLRKLYDYQIKYSQIQAHTRPSPKNEHITLNPNITSSVMELDEIPSSSATSPELRAEFDHACSITFRTSLSFAGVLVTPSACYTLTSFDRSFCLLQPLIDYADQYSGTRIQGHVVSIFDVVPWKELISFVGLLVNSAMGDWSFEHTSFATPEQDGPGPLPEDYLARGQVWSQSAFPDKWFADGRNDEEPAVEHASTVKARESRALWLLGSLAKVSVHYDFLIRCISNQMSAQQRGDI